MGDRNLKQGIWQRVVVAMMVAVCLSGLDAFGLGTTARLAPQGMTILKEELAKYPKFDRLKYVKEAEKRFPLVKKGTNVTIVYRRKEATGAFKGCRDNCVIIGTTKVPVIDMTRTELARFLPRVNEEERKKYVARLETAYRAKRTAFERKIFSKLKLKYPAATKQTFARIFSKLEDKTLADKCINDLVDTYNKSLPIPDGMSQKQFLRDIFYKFMASREDIALDGVYAISMEEKKKREEARRKIEEARRARLAARIIYPRVSTPEFLPDGGAFDKKMKVRILCDTPGAIIHYTVNGDAPTEASPVYKEPLPASLRMQLKAVAFHPSFNDSDIACMDSWTSSGLFASYFNRCCFTGLTRCRLDKSVALRWWKGTSDRLPDGINPEYFSVMWAGQLVPPKTGTYTFYLSGDDGVRMWLNGKMFIDGWKEQATTTYNAETKLEAGKRYDIKLALINLTSLAAITLEWKPPGESRQIIPGNCFIPKGRSVAIMKKWNVFRNGVYVNRKKMKNPGDHKGKVLPWMYVTPTNRDHALKHLHMDWTTP